MPPERRKPSQPASSRATKKTLLEMALTDALTGLPNRRALDDVLERMWSSSEDPQLPWCVAIADIDFFKSFNDRFGHPAGDECLKQVARALASSVRAEDVVGRYGGEEFLIVFRDATLPTAVEVAERVRESVATTDIEVRDVGRVAVSVSVGLVQAHVDRGESIAQIVAAADEALYEAKRSGRNRVVAPGHAASLLRHVRTRSRLAAPPLAGSLVGRDTELAQVRQLLTTQRLVTIVGAGGIGKTRLAQAAAREARASFRDGVVFFELTNLTDPRRVFSALAERFGVHQSDDAPRALCAVLETQQALLILDNCEHVVDAAANLVTTLLHACPKLCVLATSREPLNLEEETLLHLPALDNEAAVTLFELRARHATSRFRLDDGVRPIVSEICNRVDGMPLAIELAASRVRAMTPQDILRGLNDRFELLAGRSRARPARHQTLRALFDWSYALLPEPERRLFRRCAAFSGGWTLEAATAVWNGDGPLLPVLTQLVDKSLIVADANVRGASRYRMLESTRAYALELSKHAGELDETSRRHASYVAHLAESAENDWPVTSTDRWLEPLALEVENLRAALRWSRAQDGERSTAARIAVNAGRWWFELGLSREGARVLTRLLADGAVPEHLLPRANLWCAKLLADFHSTESLLYAERALDLARQGTSPLILAQCLLQKARALSNRGDLVASEALYREAHDLFERAGDAYGKADATMALATMRSFANDIPEALRLHVESLKIFQRLGKINALGRCLGNIGTNYELLGEVDKAIGYFHESSLQFERTGNRPMLAWIQKNLAEAELMRGNLQSARALLAQAIGGASLMGFDWLLALDFTLAARLSLAERNLLAAMQLAGFADASLEHLGQPRQPGSHALYLKFLTELRKRVDDESFEWNYEHGRRLDLAQARALL